MCDTCDSTVSARIGRRAFLRGSAALATAIPFVALSNGVAGAASPASPSARLADLGVRPRQEWAAGIPPAEGLAQEHPEDVRFLLVQHTASPNRYDPADVPGLIRGFHQAHTGPDKSWPDVAYNFFVDRHGGLWEGRTGSLSGPVKPDATGGSQGFAQLCCLIGDHQDETPTDAAQKSMTMLLAALADTYSIDTTPGASVSFVSRGSNRWPTGDLVSTATIAGHRDMSRCICPGDAAYELVQSVLPAAVTSARAPATNPATLTSAEAFPEPSGETTPGNTTFPATERTTDPSLPGTAARLGIPCCPDRRCHRRGCVRPARPHGCGTARLQFEQIMKVEFRTS